MTEFSDGYAVSQERRKLKLNNFLKDCTKTPAHFLEGCRAFNESLTAYTLGQRFALYWVDVFRHDTNCKGLSMWLEMRPKTKKKPTMKKEASRFR